MPIQTTPQLRDDGNWYMPPIDPAETLDDTLDFSKSMTDGDRINGAAWVTDGIDQIVANNTYDATTATVWLTNATAGVTATVTGHISTQEGRVMEQSFKVEAVLK